MKEKENIHPLSMGVFEARRPCASYRTHRKLLARIGSRHLKRKAVAIAVTKTKNSNRGT
ncbi:hypothetical protein M513_01913 [Trichuris suis]|uniref:Uncharacterized protein n=1 Tax=Trichuris suis TaxID=68888 RepID=A0A085MII2_9BILA|nr:hypothetical protein M513_01913 [Trichuris suis]